MINNSLRISLVVAGMYLLNIASSCDNLSDRIICAIRGSAILGSGAGSACIWLEPKPNESANDGRVGFEIDRRRHGGDPHLGITDSILGSTAKCLTPAVQPQISLTVRAHLTVSQRNQRIKAV